MKFATILIFSIIVIGAIAAGITLISSSGVKTGPQNADAQSSTQKDGSGQVPAGHHDDYSTESGQPPKPDQTPIGEKPGRTPSIFQSKNIIKDIRKVMINNVQNDDSTDSLSEEELRKISSFVESSDVDLEDLELYTDDDSIDFEKSLKFTMRLLKAFAKDEITNLKFVKKFMEKIVAEINFQVGPENPTHAEVMKNIPVMIDCLKSFLIYEYMVLTDDSGNSATTANSTNNLIITLSSKAETLDTNYKDNYMYYNAALLLSNYLFSFSNYKGIVEKLPTWKQQYKESFDKCKIANSDAFKFYSSTYKLLKIIDEE